MIDALETNDRTVIYKYGKPCCSEPHTKVNKVHNLSMIGTKRWVYFFSFADMSLHSTAVRFRYQYQNDIGYEFVFRTNGRTYVLKPVNICISVLKLKFGQTNTLCMYIY
jgi:hypothetical protein